MLICYIYSIPHHSSLGCAANNIQPIRWLLSYQMFHFAPERYSVKGLNLYVYPSPNLSNRN